MQPRRSVTIEDVKNRSSMDQRALVPPKVDVRVTTAADKQKAIEAARRVIQTHIEVFEALRNR